MFRGCSLSGCSCIGNRGWRSSEPVWFGVPCCIHSVSMHTTCITILCNSAIITSYWLGAEGHARPEQQSLTEKGSFQHQANSLYYRTVTFGFGANCNGARVDKAHPDTLVQPFHLRPVTFSFIMSSQGAAEGRSIRSGIWPTDGVPRW